MTYRSTGSRLSSLVFAAVPALFVSVMGGCQKSEGEEVMVRPGSTGGSGGVDGGLIAIGIGTGGAMGLGGMPDADVVDVVDVASERPSSDVPSSAGSDTVVREVAPEVTPPPTDVASETSTMTAVYAGLPWNNTPQAIPGMVQAPLYDQGGEGVAYHDGDAKNLGADQAKAGTAADRASPEASFRTTEGVDLRSTRAGLDQYTDGTILQAGQLYVGWTQSGEWINYTVNVRKAGNYTIAALIASLVDGVRVTFTLEDGTTTGPRALPWTHAYTLWRFADNVGGFYMSAGLHVLTLRFETAGVNLEYLTFSRDP